MSHQVAICQPHYIPWIGYFEMIDRVDEFTFLDDVDFIKREWKNRNRIRRDRTSSETKWLSVPIERASQRGTHISDAQLAREEARKLLLGLLRGKAIAFSRKTLEDLASDYLRRHATPHKAARSAREDARMWRLYVLPALGQARPTGRVA